MTNGLAGAQVVWGGCRIVISDWKGNWEPLTLLEQWSTVIKYMVLDIQSGRNKYTRKMSKIRSLDDI